MNNEAVQSVNNNNNKVDDKSIETMNDTHVNAAQTLIDTNGFYEYLEERRNSILKKKICAESLIRERKNILDYLKHRCCEIGCLFVFYKYIIIIY
jgi:predicted ester cyclase